MSEKLYVFDGIRLKKKQQKLVTLLSSCKEIRDTSYPLDNSTVRELTIESLHASKQKGYTYITGTLLLSDGEEEYRNFVAYMTEKDNEYHILMDITRVNDKEPKMIRTTDIIVEEEDKIISHTSYCNIGLLEEKIFEEVFSKNYLEERYIRNAEQLSAF